MIIFTIIAANYFPRALKLAESIRNSDLKARLVLYIVELPGTLPVTAGTAFDDVLHVADLAYDAFEAFMFRHSIVEASTAIKARAFLHLLSRFSEERDIVYLDPDIWVFSPFEELDAAFAQGSIVVTPHLLMDEVGPERVGPIIFELLNGGIFNLGFLAIRRSQESLLFLEWWKEKTEAWCYDDRPNGLFVDQKWIDFAVPFADFAVLHEPGYNVAFWNVPCRQIVQQDSRYLVNTRPLRFIHFSNLNNDERTKWFLSHIPVTNAIHDLVDEYLKTLSRLGQENWQSHAWSYDTYRSGEKICKQARVAYRSSQLLSKMYPNPFGASNSTLLSAFSAIQKYTQAPAPR